jgi:hypothetical protein
MLTCRQLVVLMAVLGFIILIAGCGEDNPGGDATPPTTPVLKPRSVDSLYEEAGIRPEAANVLNYWIRVEWYLNTEDDLEGYFVYRRGEDEEVFPEAYVGNVVAGQDFFLGQDPHFIDYDTANLRPDPSTGETRGYYYRVQAYDESGNLSEFSSVVYYRLIANPLSPHVTMSHTGEYYLDWTFQSGPQVFIDYYMLRIWDKVTNQPMWWMKYSNFGSTLSVLLDEDNALETFIPGRDYVWKLSVIANGNPPERSPAGCAVRMEFTY